MIKIALAAAVCTIAAGCVATTPKAEYLVSGTENTVQVNWANAKRGSTGALAAADAHCSKYGRRAQFAGQVTDHDLAYNCIK